MTETVYLALGSNLGDRMKNIQQALTALGTHVTIERLSPLYETAPLYLTTQPAFYNMVCQGVTTYSPRELLMEAKNIEMKLGREAGERFGPRVIDIDILFYGSECIETDELTIPHPRISERAFVLVPLRDLNPRLVLLPSKKTVQELLDGLGNWHRQVWPAGISL